IFLTDIFSGSKPSAYLVMSVTNSKLSRRVGRFVTGVWSCWVSPRALRSSATSSRKSLDRIHRTHLHFRVGSIICVVPSGRQARFGFMGNAAGDRPPLFAPQFAKNSRIRRG